jgi:hypothetical protein
MDRVGFEPTTSPQQLLSKAAVSYLLLKRQAAVEGKSRKKKERGL